MTVIRPNSISGITSITAQANEINVFRSNGLIAGLNLNGVNFNTTAGISTLAALKVTGNVDVAGVLTYQDVTNVDSLGIGTFRTGINVSGGQLDVGSNIKLGNAGVITATSFVGSGANLTGIQVGGASSLSFNDSVGAYFGNSQDLKIYHDSSHSYIHNTGGNLILRSNYLTLRNEASDQVSYYHENNGTTMLYYAGSTKIRTTSTGIRVTDDISIGDKIVHEGDTNTAIRFPAADTITAETGGSERLRIGSDGTLSKYLNSSTVQAAFGGTGQVNGITALPSMAGTPFVVGRDTGSTRSAHFGGHLQFDSGYGLQGTEFSVYGNTSGLYLNSLVSGDAIIFQTHNGSSVGERLRITSAGRMGLGETSPDGDLHIKSSNPGIFLEDSTGSSQHGQAIIEQNGDNLKIRQDAGNASSGTASNISLQVDAFERLKIASSGALTNTTNSSHSQGAGTFNIKGVISQYSQGSGSGLIFDCDFGRLTGYCDNGGIANSANLSAALAHSTTDWTSSSSTTPMTVNGGTFQYRVGFGGYMEGISNGGRVLVTAGSGSPNMADKLNTAAMTIECWCWYDGTDREVLVSRYGSGFPNNFNMLTDPNGQFHYNSSGAGAGSGNVSGEHFPDKTWHHHLWQYESGVHRWYINGAFANSRTGGSSVAVSSSTGFGIFSRADDYERFRGKIAIVRIYNRALSAAEIKNHFELERGRFGV